MDAARKRKGITTTFFVFFWFFVHMVTGRLLADSVTAVVLKE